MSANNVDIYHYLSELKLEVSSLLPCKIGFDAHEALNMLRENDELPVDERKLSKKSYELLRDFLVIHKAVTLLEKRNRN